jgi:general secretion pathway protein A
MDQQFFNFMGLREDPFHVSPDPRFYYFSPAHEAALAEILYGVETRKGLMVLTGEAGTGKTSLLNLVMDWLHRRGRSCAFIFHTRLEPIGLLKIILSDFGVPCESKSKSELVKTLHNWLLQRHHAGDLPVLILDEAQALPARTLDELRLLLNLETPRGKLLQIILSGQPELDDKLRLRGLRQLHQRVMCYTRLPVLTEKETGAYISTRLATADCSNTSLFPQEAVQEIFKCSEGIPRVVNLLCEHAMIAAYTQQQRAVTVEMIQRIASEFDLAAKPLGATDEELAGSYERFGPLKEDTKQESLASQYKAHWWAQIEFDALAEREAAEAKQRQQVAEAAKGDRALRSEPDTAVAVAVADGVETPSTVEDLGTNATADEPVEPVRRYWRKHRTRMEVVAVARNSMATVQRRWQGFASEMEEQGRRVLQSLGGLRTRVAQARMTRARMARVGVVQESVARESVAAPSKTRLADQLKGLTIDWGKHRLAVTKSLSAVGGFGQNLGTSLRHGWHSFTEPTFSYVRSVSRSFVHDGRMLFRMMMPPTPALEHGSSLNGGEQKAGTHRNILEPIKHWLSQPIKARNGASKSGRAGRPD